MKRWTRLSSLMMSALLALGAGACDDGDEGSDPTTTTEASAPVVGPGGENPASAYCEENGGSVEIRDDPEGQAGHCVFSDGSECEEFAFMNGECAPGDNPG